MKRILSLFLTMVVILSSFAYLKESVFAVSYIKSPSSTTGTAYTSSTTLSAALNSVFNGDIDIYSNSGCSNETSMVLGSSMSTSTKYYVKSKTTGNVINGKQCYIYANAVYNKLFNEWVGHGTSFSQSQVVISGGSNSVSYSMFSNAGVKCGAYMRTTNNSNGAYNGSSGHSLIILSYDSNYITYLEGNADGKGLIRITKQTWSEFNSGELSGRSRYISHIVQPTSSYYNSHYPVIEGGCTCSASYAGNYICTTSTSNLTIRSGHGTSYSKIGSIPKGATVYVSKASGNTTTSWAHVTYNGVSGYSSMQYLSKVVQTYTITYNANGGSGAPSSQTKTYGQTLTLSSTKPTRSGYTFLGWSTSNTATNATYSAGGSFTANANTTLYAVWQKNHSHSYTATVTKASTCTQSGVKTFKCSCGASYTQSIAALGHLYSIYWSIDKYATCTQTGSKSHHCERCGNKTNVTVIAAKGHTKSSWITDFCATVNNSGSKHKECTECGEILETATINQLKCSKPSLKKIKNTADGVKITWGKVSGADKYYVYRKTGSNGKYSKIGTTSKTAYTDKKSKSGKKYYYYVKAVNEAGSSSASKSKSILYLADTTLKTPSSTKKGIVLKWGKVTGAEGYKVYRKTGSGSYEKIATVKGSTKVTYTDKKAKKGKTYTYKIKAYKSKTTSAYSNAKKIKDKY